MVSGYPVLKCLSTLQALGMACVGNVPYNALQVQEQSAVPMYFAALFGMHTMTVTAVATASVRGGAPSPYNVALVIDTTLSVAHSRRLRLQPRLRIALNGVQILLQTTRSVRGEFGELHSITVGWRYQLGLTSCSLAFPNVSTTTTAQDTSCTTSVPSPPPRASLQEHLQFGQYD